jgi:hypothetical protein
MSVRFDRRGSSSTGKGAVSVHSLHGPMYGKRWVPLNAGIRSSNTASCQGHLSRAGAFDCTDTWTTVLVVAERDLRSSRRDA